MMYVQSLHVRSAEGLSEPMALPGLVPGLQVVLGPNGAGKSTAAQALSQLWWPSLDARQMVVRARVALDDAVHDVTHHAGRTTWSGPAPKLPSVAMATRYRLSLASMLAVQEADLDLFRWIRTEAMGGQDPWALRRQVEGKAPGNLTVRETRARTEAGRQLLQAESQAEQLLREAAREQALQARAEAGADLVREQAALELRREQLRLLAEARSLELQGEGLAEGVARVWPDDADTADALVERRERLTARAQAVAADLARLQPRLQAAPAEVPAGLLAELRARVESYGRAHDKAQEAELAVHAARGACTELAQAWRTDARAPTEAALDALRAWAERIEAAEAEVAAASAWQAGQQPRPVPGPDGAQVREGLVALGRAQARPAWWKMGLVASVAGGVGLAAVAGVTGWVMAWIGCGVCMGFGAGAWAVGGAVASGGADHLEAWEASLRAEEAVRAWHRQADQLRVRRGEAEHKLRGVRRRAAEALAAEGFAVQHATVRQWLVGHQAQRLMRARQVLVEREQALKVLSDAVERAHGQLAELCRHHTLAVPTDPPQARGLLAEVERQEAEGRAAATLRAEVAGRRAEQVDLQERLAALSEEEVAFASRVGCQPTEAGLIAQRVEQGERARALQGRRAEVAAQLRSLAERLAEAGVAVDHLDEAEVDAREVAIEAALSEAEQAREDLGGLRARLEAAGQGSRFAEALAARDAAQAELESLRDERLQRWLQAELLDDVLRDADAGRSEQLRVVQRWFARFTRGRYGLRLGPTQELVGFDEETGQPLALEALSDATRVQALLAARVAGVQWAEEGGPAVPLCLDEVLSTTDPERFDEVVGCLCELGSERQLLYFTSDPAEADRVRTCAARRGVRVPIHGLRAEVPVSPVPALPATQPPTDPVAWAEALTVPALQLDHAVGAWHLAHLLPDAPEVLSRLVHRGIDTVGRYQALARASGQELAPAVLEGRAEMARSLVELARVGRGARVPLGELQASGLVSSAFWERAVDVHDEVGGDGPALLEGIEGLKGFRSANKAKLRSLFEARGWIDPRPELPADRAIGQAAAPFVGQDPQALHLARRWWQALRKDIG